MKLRKKKLSLLYKQNVKKFVIDMEGVFLYLITFDFNYTIYARNLLNVINRHKVLLRDVRFDHDNLVNLLVNTINNIEFNITDCWDILNQPNNYFSERMEAITQLNCLKYILDHRKYFARTKGIYENTYENIHGNTSKNYSKNEDLELLYKKLVKYLGIIDSITKKKIDACKEGRSIDDVNENIFTKSFREGYKNLNEIYHLEH